MILLEGIYLRLLWMSSPDDLRRQASSLRVNGVTMGLDGRTTHRPGRGEALGCFRYIYAGLMMVDDD